MSLVRTLLVAALLASPIAGLAETDAALGERLARQYFELAGKGDLKAIEAMLSPAMQVVRADGSVSDRGSFQLERPSFKDFTLSGFHVTRDGDTLVVRYQATVSETIRGVPYSASPSPRLTVFHWNGKAWQLIAHANFNAPAKR